MSKTTIYYFSATGNSLVVARGIAKVLDIGDPISIPGSLINEDPYIDARGAKAVGFVFPVQRASIPEMLRGFLLSMPVDPDCYYFAVSTYSLFGSNEFGDIDEILSAAGASLNYAAGVRMMGNVGMSKPSQATIERRLKLMENSIDEIATAVAYHQENDFPRSSKILGRAVQLFTGMRRKRIVFKVDKKCKKCGICALVCPVQNIHLPSQDSSSRFAGPMRSDKCEACLACVHWCPAAAVSASRAKHVSYHNPHVHPDELHSQFPLGGLNAAQTAFSNAKDTNAQEADLQLDAELAAALRDDLITPADIDSWLSTSQVAEDLSPSYRLQSTEYAGANNMSKDEIAQALSELES